MFEFEEKYITNIQFTTTTPYILNQFKPRYTFTSIIKIKLLKYSGDNEEINKYVNKLNNLIITNRVFEINENINEKYHKLIGYNEIIDISEYTKDIKRIYE
jgi:hypothetical protein